MEILLLILIVLLLIGAIVLQILLRKPGDHFAQVDHKLVNLQASLANIETNLKEDSKANREENTFIAKENRHELNNSIREFKAELSSIFQDFTRQSHTELREVNKTVEDKMEALVSKIDENNKSNREELAGSLSEFSRTNSLQLEKINAQARDDSKLNREAMLDAFRGFQDTFDSNIKSFNDLLREKFAQLDTKQNELVKHTERQLESIRITVEEKLEKTLSERLGQSFETVGKQLIEVQKGLGEMQTLAQDVGGLKRVLSNVKMRGGFGEVQLHMMLESILAPEQYEANVVTKQGSGERVEYAVKFPNKDGDREFVWLPIDAKFPKTAYETLQAACDSGDQQSIENAQKGLEVVIKKMAKDICGKYLDAPNTTNFGIMFLPFEGLFAEVVRKASLLEEIQREYNIVITGPTTLAVILNSLQMGFRTLAIQKRSSEVWKILSAVKKEFSLFGGMLDKAQRNIQTGLNQLDDVVGVRTRAIQRQLRGVESVHDLKEHIEIEDTLDREFLGSATPENLFN